MALALSSCNSDPKFNVKGDVSGADGKMLYLEASGLEGIVPLDSIKIEKETVHSVLNNCVPNLLSFIVYGLKIK